EEQRKRVALLHPAIAIDPEIEIEAREVARQERPRRQRLVAVLEFGATGKVEVPLRYDQCRALSPAPGALLVSQAAIEHAQRQAYRMMELKRWRDHLGVKVTLEPKFFPANEVPAARCVVALREQGRMADAIKLAHAVLNALWAEERNTGDPATLKAIITECGLDSDAVIRAGEAPQIAAKRDEYTKHAIDQGV